jgi:spermidine synthase
LAGFCTMSYEVLWFRVLKYFVDNSIHSFGIVLITFLFGLTAGSFLVSRFIGSRKERFLFLAAVEISIGLLCLISIPVIANLNSLMQVSQALFGPHWGGEVAVRFFAFSIVMVPPTALMGGAFPLLSAMYAQKGSPLGRSLGEIYCVNTVGGVIGSFAGGFALVPLLGVQNGIAAVAIVNILIGIASLVAAARVKLPVRMVAGAGALLVAGILFIAIPGNAFVHVYDVKYPAPANEMLYCKENLSGTTAVFQDAKNDARRFLLIDGAGEVSTDYFSMRAFRFLSLLPALYAPRLSNALIVTFGSGIVAGAIGRLPGLEHEDCVEICSQAFEAARFFSAENHDVLDNPRVHRIVNDGRNYVFTTNKRYDIISADATHPSSSDSWILYTREFYALCKSKLTGSGIMCQWIPLHGILESDYKTILKTFHAVFPYVAVYYSGGQKEIGHTVLLGSASALEIDVGRAQWLLGDRVVKEDLARVNVFSLYDFYNGFIMDQDSIGPFAGDAPLNTDDLPRVIFSKFKLEKNPFMGIGPLAKYRAPIFTHLRGIESDSLAAIRTTLQRNFEATGYALEGQTLELKEYCLRMAQNFDQSKVAVMDNLNASKALFEQFLSKYDSAAVLNPGDFNTAYLLKRASSEYKYLTSFLDAMDRRSQEP